MQTEENLPNRMRHFEDPFLYSRHVIRILADDLRLRRLFDLQQLFRCECGREARVLEPETISSPNIRKLTRDDAGERRSNDSTWHSVLGYPS